jgi:hypothetical protein
MAHETRTSEQGAIFDSVSIVRDFLLKALGHDAVIDQVTELLFDHLEKSQYHSSVVAESLKRVIAEVLEAAIFEDWDWVAQALIAEACESLGIEHPLDRTPGVQPPKTRIRRALRSLDPGELREKLADIYTHEYLPLSTALRARWITRKIAHLTGISREQIQADAKADAEAIQVADEGTAAADQRSAPTGTDTLDVTVRLPQAFVRPLGRDEALTLMQKGEESKVSFTRKRAAIILASNVGVTTSQLAAMHAMDKSEVLKVIAEFNERGVTSVGDSPQ